MVIVDKTRDLFADELIMIRGCENRKNPKIDVLCLTATSSIVESNVCRRFVRVPLRRLDSIVEGFGLKRVDVMKYRC
jgi:hypothetical protein